jgi:hypothetical protein
MRDGIRRGATPCGLIGFESGGKRRERRGVSAVLKRSRRDPQGVQRLAEGTMRYGIRRSITPWGLIGFESGGKRHERRGVRGC